VTRSARRAVGNASLGSTAACTMLLPAELTLARNTTPAQSRQKPTDGFRRAPGCCQAAGGVGAFGLKDPRRSDEQRRYGLGNALTIAMTIGTGPCPAGSTSVPYLHDLII